MMLVSLWLPILLMKENANLGYTDDVAGLIVILALLCLKNYWNTRLSHILTL